MRYVKRKNIFVFYLLHFWRNSFDVDIEVIFRCKQFDNCSLFRNFIFISTIVWKPNSTHVRNRERTRAQTTILYSYAK